MSTKRSIWKFGIQISDRISIAMPAGAKILYIDTQHGNAQMWVEVDPTKLFEVREFAVHGTGHPYEVDNRKVYLASFQLHGGALVFHVFEILPIGVIPGEIV